MIKVYDAPFGGTRGSRVRWILEEVGAKYEHVPVDVRTGEQRSPEHVARHAHGLVPAVDVDGQRLIESAAICMHIADLFPAAKLAPAVGTAERAQWYQWIVYAPATLDEASIGYLFHTKILPPEQRKTEPVERGRAVWSVAAPLLSRTLEGREFLVGNQFSAADVVLGYVAGVAARTGLLEGHPTLGAYVQRLSSRPAFKKVFGE